MKRPHLQAVLLLLILCAIRINITAQELYEDKTSAPYFLVLNDGENSASMPLKYTGAEVNIAGVIADVTITQVYQNTGKKAIEAQYVFPASTRAAVYSMRMTVGKRVIDAEIEEKQQAKAIYEQAKSEGKTASLLEQHRPNIFQMHVANILPGDSIVINMSYTELLVPENGIYEFVYPTVVGPRYTGEKNEPEVAGVHSKNTTPFTANPHSLAGVKPTYGFGMKINVQAGLPISEVESPSHRISVKADAANELVISLDPEEITGGNRDFILRYSLRDNQIQNGMLAYKGDKENFFLYMMQPPKRAEPEIITKREYIFVVDVSGSMNGFPLEVSKELLSNLVGNLNAHDLFNVLLFAGTGNLWSPQSQEANEQNINQAIDFINWQLGSGSTHLYDAMQQALNIREREGYAKTIVICTDGYVNVEPEVFRLIQQNLNKANIFAFGIGSSVNRHIIEGIAYLGRGEPFVVIHGDEASKTAERFKEYIESPLLTDINITFGDMEVYDVEPLTIPDLFADRPLIIYGKYKGALSGTINVTGKNGAGDYSSTVELDKIKPSDKNKALRYLWARERIKILGDYQGLVFDETRKAAITKLGLDYNLLTEYTSFVAVYKKVRTDEPADSTIQQILPLPAGVPNSAVRASGSSSGVNAITITSSKMLSQGNAAPYSSIQNISPGYFSSSVNLNAVVVSTEKYSKVIEENTSMCTVAPARYTGSSMALYNVVFPHQYRLMRSQYLTNDLPLDNGLSASRGIRRIPSSWIETISFFSPKLHVENGFEAPLGTVETTLWNSSYANDLRAGLEVNHFGEMDAHFNGAYRINDAVAGKLLFSARYSGAKIDNNKDNFLDIPLVQDYQVYQSWKFRKQLRDAITFHSEAGVLYAYENERGGEKKSNQNEEFDTLSSYGTQLKNQHLALFSKSALHINRSSVRFDVTGTLDKLNRFYGLNIYEGKSNDLWMRALYTYKSGRHNYFAGADYRAADYSEQLNQIVQNRTGHDLGLFARYHYESDRINARAGMRTDYHTLFNWLWSPSVNVSYRAARGLYLSASADRRYRIPKALLENLGYAYSSRSFTLEGDVLPEVSWNFNAGVRYVARTMHAGLAYERVQFQRRLVTDLDQAQQVVIYNSKATSFENRISAYAFALIKNKMQADVRYTYNVITTAYKSGKNDEPFIPNHSLSLSLAYAINGFSTPSWTFALSGQLMGKQRIPNTSSNPEVHQRAAHSPCFFLLNAQVNKYYRKWRFYAGATNLLNFRMKNPVIASETPLNPYFDASMIWGPVTGVQAHVGFTYNLHK